METINQNENTIERMLYGPEEKKRKITNNELKDWHIKRLRLLISKTTGVPVEFQDEINPKTGRMWRKKERVFSRHLLMKALKEHTKCSLAEIGSKFAIKLDHASALHGVRAIEDVMFTDKCMKAEIDAFLVEAGEILSMQEEMETTPLRADVDILKDEVKRLMESERILRNIEAVLTGKVNSLTCELEILSGEFRLLKKKLDYSKYESSFT